MSASARTAEAGPKDEGREQREVAWYARELQKLLSNQRLTLTDIVDAMHFSSQPALTRYIKRVMHTSPSEFRQRTFHPK